MLGFLFGSSASESERDSLKKKCATRESAVKVCLRGNSAAACDNFQQDLDLCKVSRDDDDDDDDDDNDLSRRSPPVPAAVTTPCPV